MNYIETKEGWILALIEHHADDPVREYLALSDMKNKNTFPLINLN